MKGPCEGSHMTPAAPGQHPGLWINVPRGELCLPFHRHQVCAVRRKFPWPLCYLQLHWLFSSVTNFSLSVAPGKLEPQSCFQERKITHYISLTQEWKMDWCRHLWVFCNFISQIWSLFDQSVCEYKNNDLTKRLTVLPYVSCNHLGLIFPWISSININHINTYFW